MRIWVFSDIHADVCEWTPPDPRPEHDVVVVAGDVSSRLSDRVLPWLERNLGTGTPVVYVPGNHDFYRTRLHQEIDKARMIAAEIGIHLLADGENVVLGGVRFIGATLWTDYELRGDAYGAKLQAAAVMTDHRAISTARARWTPTMAQGVHVMQRARIVETLVVPHDGPTVVVTHHAPHPQSLQVPDAPELLDGAYASDLGWIMERPDAPDLWIHGHVHSSHDYIVGGTKVVCNPRGYVTHTHRRKGAGPTVEVENPAFDPFLTLTI